MADQHALEAIERQVTLFMRMGERVRLGSALAVGSRLDRSGYLLLSRLAADGPRTVPELAATLQLDASTVTRQVAPLQDAALVERGASAPGVRGNYIQLTAAGRDELARVRAARLARFAELTAEWSEAERTIFGELLGRFNAAARTRPGS